MGERLLGFLLVEHLYYSTVCAAISGLGHQFYFILFWQNTIIDERGSLSMSTPAPGPLMSLLRSVKKVGVLDGLLSFSPVWNSSCLHITVPCPGCIDW